MTKLRYSWTGTDGQRLKTEGLEIIKNCLSNFVTLYDEIKAGEKKLFVENVVKKVNIGKSKEIKLPSMCAL